MKTTLEILFWEIQGLVKTILSGILFSVLAVIMFIIGVIAFIAQFFTGDKNNK